MIFVFIKKKKYLSAKVYLSILFIINTFNVGFIIFSSQTGLHLYFLVFPPLALLIFNPEEIKIKLILSFFALALLILSEIWSQPYIIISLDVQ